ncbi:MAG: S1 RNA-binding domain-containing protein, partial [bacterium]|nr:S1 RNA-binding domain-containing protein [bacterium]
QDPWQEFAESHQVGELVYGRVTKLVPFGAFVQVGESIEGLVHISEIASHHIELPEQVVTPGEELWVKIIDLDVGQRRISLSIKQAAEGGVVAAEFQEHFGEHAYDEEGNYIGTVTAESAETDTESTETVTVESEITVEAETVAVVEVAVEAETVPSAAASEVTEAPATPEVTAPAEVSQEATTESEELAATPSG